MSSDFVKFPSTPHLMLIGGTTVRDDKIMSPEQQRAFLNNFLVVEEKIDGANLGISFDQGGNLRVQNRGSYIQLPGHGQWRSLDKWLYLKLDNLLDALSDRYILFGEWCYAQHSVFYDLLPDWFLGFDIYDKIEKRFLSTPRRDVILSSMHVFSIPTIARGEFTVSALKRLFGRSKYSTGQDVEGLYLRHDEGDWLGERAKLVRPSFVQAIEMHWSRSTIRPNRITQGSSPIGS